MVRVHARPPIANALFNNDMFLKEAALIVLGAILGVIGQWLFYRFQKRDERNEGPHIVMTKVVHDGQIVVELRNIGNDSLSDMDVTATWNTNGETQKRVLKQFFLPEQNFQTDASRHVELLGPSERYVLTGLPQNADNGIIDMTVAGTGVKSQKLYEVQSEIIVERIQQ